MKRSFSLFISFLACMALAMTSPVVLAQDQDEDFDSLEAELFEEGDDDSEESEDAGDFEEEEDGEELALDLDDDEEELDLDAEDAEEELLDEDELFAEELGEDDDELELSDEDFEDIADEDLTEEDLGEEDLAEEGLLDDELLEDDLLAEDDEELSLADEGEDFDEEDFDFEADLDDFDDEEEFDFEDTSEEEVVLTPEPFSEPSEETIESTQTVSEPSTIPDFDQALLSEPPDEQFEDRLFEIYENYNKTPISNQEWGEIAGEITNEIYLVTEGDSLWVISEIFFGDGNYWPKVWSFNDAITNPHVIEVNDRIVFYPGDEENAPRVVVESQEEEGGPLIVISEQQIAEVDVEQFDPEAPVVSDAPTVIESEFGELEIPSPSRNYIPPLRVIPPSLPEERRRFSDEFDASGFAGAGQRYAPLSSVDMRLTSFITDEYPQPIGSVVEMMGGRQTAQLYEYVYVQMERGLPGQIFTVVSTAYQGAESKELEFEEGFVLQYLGEIELGELVNPEQGIYRALATSIIHPLEIGAAVVPGVIPKAKVDNIGPEADVQGSVIGGEFDLGRKALGVGSVVFLNVGEEDGLREGDIVGVLANESLRNPETSISRILRRIGRIKVIKVESTVSTGLVVHASDQISTGDFVGRPDSSEGGQDVDDLDVELEEEDLEIEEDGLDEEDLEEDLLEDELFEDDLEEDLDEEEFEDEDLEDDLEEDFEEDFEGEEGDEDFEDEDLLDL